MTDLRAFGLTLVILVLSVDIAAAQDSGLVRGSQLLAPYKHALQQALRAGLDEGEAAAIEACRIQAPEIALSLSQAGIRAGRSSQQLRNPANAAPDWVEPILLSYADNPAQQTPRTVNLPGGRLGYVEPILLQPVCLACHGDAIAPDIRARIRELYPDDRATGFQVGDLRGVFWIEYPAAE